MNDYDIKHKIGGRTRGYTLIEGSESRAVRS